MNDHEWQISFTLAAGYDENDAIELYELIERHRAVHGAALTEVMARYRRDDPISEERPS